MDFENEWISIDWSTFFSDCGEPRSIECCQQHSSLPVLPVSGSAEFYIT